MHRSKLVLAEHSARKLIKDMDNTFRVPWYMSKHTKIVIDNYRDIIHDLLAIIKDYENDEHYLDEHLFKDE